MLSLLLILAAAAEPDEFKPSPERFADAASCRAALTKLVAEARRQDYVAVQGPYRIAMDDLRIHMVRAEENGHRITEHRCLGASLASRSWRHGMEEAEEPVTIESMAAEWLKKDRPQQ